MIYGLFGFVVGLVSAPILMMALGFLIVRQKDVNRAIDDTIRCCASTARSGRSRPSRDYKAGREEAAEDILELLSDAGETK